jgi:hypothetical protein
VVYQPQGPPAISRDDVEMPRFHVIARLLATIALVVAGMAVVGGAAGLTAASHPIGAGQVATPVCTSAAVTVVETVTTTHVTKLTLSNIPSACGGATIEVTMVAGASTYSPANQTVPGGGGTVTETIPSGDIPVSSTAQVGIVMEGP